MKHDLYLIGNLVADPESVECGRYPLTTFVVAANNKKRNDAPMYVKVAAWGKLGETCLNSLRKGALVFVRGELRVTAFTGRDGTPKATIEITADDVEFLSRPAVVTEPKPVPAAAPAADPTDPFGGFGDPSRGAEPEPKAKATPVPRLFDLWNDEDLPWPQ